jgi:hypothetical protein
MAIIVLRHCIRLTYGALPDDWIVENQDDNSRYISVSSQHVGPPQGGDSVNGGSSSGGGVRRGLKQVINVISGGGIKSRHSQHSSTASKSHSVPLLETSRTRSSSIVDPVRLTTDPGMHNVVIGWKEWRAKARPTCLAKELVYGWFIVENIA